MGRGSRAPGQLLVLATIATTDGTVSVLDLQARKLLATIGVQRDPGVMVVSPKRPRLYVANRAAGSLSVIDTDANQVKP